MGDPVLKYDEEEDHPDVYRSAGLGKLTKVIKRVNSLKQIKEEKLADLKERNKLQDMSYDDDDSDAPTGYSEKS